MKLITSAIRQNQPKILLKLLTNSYLMAKPMCDCISQNHKQPCAWWWLRILEQRRVWATSSRTEHGYLATTDNIDEVFVLLSCSHSSLLHDHVSSNLSLARQATCMATYLVHRINSACAAKVEGIRFFVPARILSTNSDAGRPSRFKQRILTICQNAKRCPRISNLGSPLCLTMHTNSTPLALAPNVRQPNCKSPEPPGDRPGLTTLTARETIYIAALLSAI